MVYIRKLHPQTSTWRKAFRCQVRSSELISFLRKTQTSVETEGMHIMHKGKVRKQGYDPTLGIPDPKGIRADSKLAFLSINPWCTSQGNASLKCFAGLIFRRHLFIYIRAETNQLEPDMASISSFTFGQEGRLRTPTSPILIIYNSQFHQTNIIRVQHRHHADPSNLPPVRRHSLCNSEYYSFIGHFQRLILEISVMLRAGRKIPAQQGRAA